LKAGVAGAKKRRTNPHVSESARLGESNASPESMLGEDRRPKVA
jgi:hypothetical protein